MIKLHEIEKKLKEEYDKHSGKLKEDDPQAKINEIFYNSIIALIKAAESSKNSKSGGFTKPFVQTKVPRKRMPFSGSGNN